MSSSLRANLVSKADDRLGPVASDNVIGVGEGSVGRIVENGLFQIVHIRVVIIVAGCEVSELGQSTLDSILEAVLSKFILQLLRD